MTWASAIVFSPSTPKVHSDLIPGAPPPSVPSICRPGIGHPIGVYHIVIRPRCRSGFAFEILKPDVEVNSEVGKSGQEP